MIVKIFSEEPTESYNNIVAYLDASSFFYKELVSDNNGYGCIAEYYIPSLKYFLLVENDNIRVYQNYFRISMEQFLEEVPDDIAIFFYFHVDMWRTNIS